MEPNANKPARGQPGWSVRWRWLCGIVAVAFCVAVASFLTQRPSYDGRALDDWFSDFVQWSSPTATGRETSRCYQVFTELEGDAVPFLIGWAQRKPSQVDRAYSKLHSSLPAGWTRRLPEPRTDGYYDGRRIHAFELLGHVGVGQRTKADLGETCTKPSVTLALPAIQAGLKDSGGTIRAFAAQAAWFIGPRAAPTLPELVKLAQNPNEPAARAAVQAFGNMGSAASNAVELLAQIATNSARGDCVLAAQALGGIGGAARSATPALASLLESTNEALRIAAARSIAEIGHTPDEAISSLLAMRQGTNEWPRAVASLALWNRDPKNAGFKGDVISILHSDKKGGMLFCLEQLGTNAAAFVPEVSRLLDDPNPGTRDWAKRTLRKIQAVSP